MSRRPHVKSTGEQIAQPVLMEASLAIRTPMLPHERDESARPEPKLGTGSRQRVRQAASDIESGLIDTEARGTPSNVPPGRRKASKRSSRLLPKRAV